MKLHGEVMLMLIYLFLAIESYWVDGASSKVPCYFIFGDSLVDNGNNNNNKGVARADYKPYGIDFSKDMIPTGRFTNGRNMADFIAEFLGYDNYIPPFKNTRGWNILKGVNYASGAAGIRDETGMAQGERSSFNQQLGHHNEIISKINELLGNKSKVENHLNSCLYMVNIGGNDYLNNYFMPLYYKTSAQFTPQQYAIALNKQLSNQFKALYENGARKIAIFGSGLVGCTPYAMAHFDHKGSPCVDKINNAIQLFNIGLKSLVNEFNTNFGTAKFIFIDAFNIALHDTSNLGQIIKDTPCCEIRSDGLQCALLGKVCGNRSEYVFWDGVHPTEIGMRTLASRAFNAQHPNDTYPFDINHLAQL
ncbi:GDSL esterase/lipase At1g29670-like [Benincasa hispida]|uniref:GDSL esterase/lipase At1g29670-like n=1 Tax=Benincasa hispida TaxID=102211 RepID=UPI00190243A8|nr:GDSL esterase/lipase At1g29670-like [Benincasa hispida]